MEFKFKNIIIYFDIIIIFIFVLSIFSKIIFSIFSCYLINYFFIFLHELSHCMVANIFNIKVKKVNVLLSGLNVNLEKIGKLTKLKRVMIFLAGPICNLLLFFILRKFIVLSYINLFLFFINLIPLKNFDGYNILKEFFNLKQLKVFSKIIFIILSVLNIIFIFKYDVYFLLIILIYYFIQNNKNNI